MRETVMGWGNCWGRRTEKRWESGLAARTGPIGWGRERSAEGDRGSMEARMLAVVLRRSSKCRRLTSLGSPVGPGEGAALGEWDGLELGLLEGRPVGEGVGLAVGYCVGAVGRRDGLWRGRARGTTNILHKTGISQGTRPRSRPTLLGDSLGRPVGAGDGDAEGVEEGRPVGAGLGLPDGLLVGAVGRRVGL